MNLQPRQPMRAEAAGAGSYISPGFGTQHPCLQIITIQELLEGKRIDMPPLRQVNITFKKAPKIKGEDAHTLALLMDK